VGTGPISNSGLRDDRPTINRLKTKINLHYIQRSFPS
jgi:hypothetical protein